jgi:hypothetical protein
MVGVVALNIARRLVDFFGIVNEMGYILPYLLRIVQDYIHLAC